VRSSLQQTRADRCRKKDDEQKSELGQFFTPKPVAVLMASMLAARSEHVRLLDAGRGWLPVCLRVTPFSRARDSNTLRVSALTRAAITSFDKRKRGGVLMPARMYQQEKQKLF
jgi:hypothetical protein